MHLVACDAWMVSGAPPRSTHRSSAPTASNLSVPGPPEQCSIPGTTHDALVHKSELAAAKIAEETGASIEILDLRSLSPHDWEAIAESVQKTSRVIVIHEDMLSWGFGSEMSARIANE